MDEKCCVSLSHTREPAEVKPRVTPAVTSDARLENCADLKTAAVTGTPETEGILLGPEMDGGGPALGRGTI